MTEESSILCRDKMCCSCNIGKAQFSSIESFECQQLKVTDSGIWSNGCHFNAYENSGPN